MYGNRGLPDSSSDDPVALCKLSAYRQSRCVLVGLGFTFNPIEVQPIFQQSRVVYFIHRRSGHCESLANAQTKISSVRIYKPWTDSSIAAMAMNQGKLALAHFPGLLHNFSECPVEHDFTGMVAVKIDLQIRSPGSP
jgi:hypothetical protein